jgi:iron complex transport system permease protein
VYFANDKDGIQTITYWLMGSLAEARWNELAVIAPIVILSVLFFWTQSRVLNLMLLGDEAAITMGTDLHVYRQAYLLVSSLIVGFAVYSAGVIGFVGLIIPHVIRMVVGPDHKHLVPVSALVGAIFLVLCDGLCRIIIPHTELPIGLLISLIGAPCFIYLMISRSYGFGGGE